MPVADEGGDLGVHHTPYVFDTVNETSTRSSTRTIDTHAIPSRPSGSETEQPTTLPFPTSTPTPTAPEEEEKKEDGTFLPITVTPAAALTSKTSVSLNVKNAVTPSLLRQPTEEEKNLASVTPSIARDESDSNSSTADTELCTLNARRKVLFKENKKERPLEQESNGCLDVHASHSAPPDSSNSVASPIDDRVEKPRGKRPYEDEDEEPSLRSSNRPWENPSKRSRNGPDEGNSDNETREDASSAAVACVRVHSSDDPGSSDIVTPPTDSRASLLLFGMNTDHETMKCLCRNRDDESVDLALTEGLRQQYRVNGLLRVRRLPTAVTVTTNPFGKPIMVCDDANGRFCRLLEFKSRDDALHLWRVTRGLVELPVSEFKVHLLLKRYDPESDIEHPTQKNCRTVPTWFSEHVREGIRAYRPDSISDDPKELVSDDNTLHELGKVLDDVRIEDIEELLENAKVEPKQCQDDSATSRFDANRQHADTSEEDATGNSQASGEEEEECSVFSKEGSSTSESSASVDSVMKESDAAHAHNGSDADVTPASDEEEERSISSKAESIVAEPASSASLAIGSNAAHGRDEGKAASTSPFAEAPKSSFVTASPGSPEEEEAQLRQAIRDSMEASGRRGKTGATAGDAIDLAADSSSDEEGTENPSKNRSWLAKRCKRRYHCRDVPTCGRCVACATGRPGYCFQKACLKIGIRERAEQAPTFPEGWKFTFHSIAGGEPWLVILDPKGKKYFSAEVAKTENPKSLADIDVSKFHDMVGLDADSDAEEDGDKKQRALSDRLEVGSRCYARFSKKQQWTFGTIKCARGKEKKAQYTVQFDNGGKREGIPWQEVYSEMEWQKLYQAGETDSE